MLGFDAVTGTVPLPLWAVGVATALFVVAAVMALRRSTIVGSLTALVAVAVLAIGAWTAWIVVEHSATRERAAERHALDARAFELTARALMPGSALACLDANAGETVENACEKSVFASPEAVAAATAYMAARLLLLADGLDYASRAERSYETALAGLRRTVEADRFGLVAHVLATRDACTPDQCAAFALLRDATVVKANLKARTYENNVARYAAIWSEPKNTPAAAVTAAPAAPAVAAVPSTIEFPSAASIPPVSIMNPEPATTAAVPPEPGAPVARKPAPPSPPQPARRPAANAAAPSSPPTTNPRSP
jgi:hypothetical protein